MFQSPVSVYWKLLCILLGTSILLLVGGGGGVAGGGGGGQLLKHSGVYISGNGHCLIVTQRHKHFDGCTQYS